jgi:capsular polysaccharide biosynthesis protein
MDINELIKLIIIFLLIVILIMLFVLTFNVLKDYKSSFKFYKTILNEKEKKDSKKGNVKKK